MPTAGRNSVRSDQIIQAAGKLFAHQGYHGTSTRQIAHLADVSENTLFRHFDHKEDLFWSTLRFYSSGLKPRKELLEGIAKCDSPEVVLPKILELLSDTVNYRPELLRLMAVAFLELQWKAEAFGHEHFSPVLSAISHYLEMNIKGGRLRDLDPTMITAGLMMTPLMHPGISKLIGGTKPTFVNGQEAGRAYAKFWLDLLTPRNLAAATPIAPAGEEQSG
jgi:AcrR family transcriptional regulator